VYDCLKHNRFRGALSTPVDGRNSPPRLNFQFPIRPGAEPTRPMKVPLSWLRDYVDVTLSVPDLAERLTLAGLEVSGLRFYGLPVPPGARIGQEAAGPVWAR